MSVFTDLSALAIGRKINAVMIIINMPDKPSFTFVGKGLLVICLIRANNAFFG